MKEVSMPERVFLMLMLLIPLSGCATPQDQTLVTQLQLRVGGLERELNLKDNQIGDLTNKMKALFVEAEQLDVRLKKQETAKTLLREKIKEKRTERKKVKEQAKLKLPSKKPAGIILVPVSTKNVQSALRNAGYYEGPLDNKIGAKTKTAIIQFQKDNELKADGIVGKKTWDELKVFLE